MSISKVNQNRKDSEKEKHQQVNHEKNAFVSGDRVYMWKNIKGKPIKVWRVVKYVDSVEGKLYFEDGKRGITIYAHNETKHDNIITTDAWEKAFALLDEGRNKIEARKNRENSVVSCETVDGYPCVVIDNSKDIKVQKKWYVRRDYWSLLKTESTSRLRYSKLRGKVGEPNAVKAVVNANPRLYVELPEECIMTNAKGKFYAWNLKSIYIIGYHCPWLKKMDAPWATEVGNVKTYNPFKTKEIKKLLAADFSDDGKTLVRCPNVEKFEIPEGVTKVLEDAFQECPNLQEIYFPSSVTNIVSYDDPNDHFGPNIFSKCPVLRKIVVSPENKAYDSRENCNAIIETTTYTEDDVEYEIVYLLHACSSTKIPNGVHYIWEGAFEGCSIKEIFIPESVGIIASDFGPSLERIIVSDRNRQLDSRDNCNAIIETSTNFLILGCASTNIPDSVVCIRGGAFAYCEKLKSVMIPHSIVRIGECAFSGTPALQEIIVDVANMYYDSREKCNAIIDTENNILIAGCTTTIIPKTVKKIGCYAFSGCSSLESIVIPEGVKEIGHRAFRGCSSLESIVISEGLEEIGYGAFGGCKNLKSITIPKSVVKLGKEVFYGCSLLSEIHFANKQIEIEGVEDAFYGVLGQCNSLQRIFVPKGSKDRFDKMGFNTYKNAIIIEE